MSPQERKQPQRPTGNGSVDATGPPHRDRPQRRVAGSPEPTLNGSLPMDYGETRVVLLPVDPYLVHAYWEISTGDMGYVEALVREGALRPQALLRFHDVTALSAGGIRASGSFDVEIDVGSRNWYVRLLSPERSYIVDLGFREGDGRFHRVARSNRAETPRAWPCAETGRQRMHVVEIDGVTHVDPVEEAAPEQEAAGGSKETGDLPRFGVGTVRQERRAVIGLPRDHAAGTPGAHKVRETTPLHRAVEFTAKQGLRETQEGGTAGKTEGARPVGAREAGRTPEPGAPPVDASEQVWQRPAAIYGRDREFPPPEAGGRLEPAGGRHGPGKAARVDLSLLCEHLYLAGLPSSRTAAGSGKDGPNDR